MPHFIELKDGVLIETDAPAEEGRLRAVPLRDSRRSTADLSFGALGKFVASHLEEFATHVRMGLGEVTPREIELKVTVGVSGETGLPFFAKGAANGNIEVTLKWGESKETQVS